jgi:hypothetical protein
LAPTPVAPIEAVAPKRPSVPLIDVDFGADEPAPEVAQVGGLESSQFEAPADVSAVESNVDTGGIELDPGLTWETPEADPDPAVEAGAADTAQPFVTETMAELYLQQGFREEALDVYRKLLEQNPDDQNIRERVESLASGKRSSLSLERVSTEVPEFAAGTDTIVPMSDPLAEPAASDVAAGDASLGIAPDAGDVTPIEELSFDDIAPVAEAPAPSVEAGFDLPSAPLDFGDDVATPAPEPVADELAEPPAVSAPEPASVSAPEPVAEPVPELAELSEEPSALPEPPALPELPLAAEADLAEPVPAEPVPALPVSALPAPAVGTNGRSARSFFHGLAQRRAVRPDGTVPGGVPVVTPEPPPARDSGSVDALFGAAPDAAEDQIGQALATAISGSEPAIRGRPTQPASSELSLDAVFRGDSPARSSGPVSRKSQHLKFDQFFSADEAPPPAAPAPDVEAAPTDDAQFSAWLKGLKDQ